MMQMHDVLPGSSVPEVYDDCYDFWLLAREWLTEIYTNALEAIQEHAHRFDAVGMDGKRRNVCAAVCKSRLTPGRNTIHKPG